MAMMLRPICVECSNKLGKAVFFEPKRNGVEVRFGYYYGYFTADLWECPECGHQMIMGYSDAEVLSSKPVEFDWGQR